MRGAFMICCVTGHRPDGFPFKRGFCGDIEFDIYINDLYNITEKFIYEGYDHFITGMADGADLDFAQSILYHKDSYEYIKLEAALPYPVTKTKKITEYIEQRNYVLEKCNITTVVSPYYFKGCMQKRNRYMVDKSDLVLAIWSGKQSGGTWDTIKYARSKNKPINYILLNELHL